MTTITNKHINNLVKLIESKNQVLDLQAKLIEQLKHKINLLTEQVELLKEIHHLQSK